MRMAESGKGQRKPKQDLSWPGGGNREVLESLRIVGRSCRNSREGVKTKIITYPSHPIKVDPDALRFYYKFHLILLPVFVYAVL